MLAGTATQSQSPMMSHQALALLGLTEVRAAIRAGAYTRHTAGLAQGHLQCNLVIISSKDADAFDAYCTRNAQACPVVGKTSPGEFSPAQLGSDIDLRTDVPRYNIYRHGELDRTVHELSDVWQDDFVSFALGCSFTFERALMQDGIPMRHVAADKTVPMFISNIITKPVEQFGGEMVVSMRPIPKEDVDRAVTISARYPLAHGAPVHIGDPAELGITDINTPDWGDAVEVKTGEIPVFWACGVTPQVALRQAKHAISITHAPGSMLITDLNEFHATTNQSQIPTSETGVHP